MFDDVNDPSKAHIDQNKLLQKVTSTYHVLQLEEKESREKGALKN